ncbi:hypothetical protein GCM10010464_16780 [Pseudonocardia yunnanensis]
MEPLDTTREGFNEDDAEIRPGQRQRYPGKPRSRTHIHKTRAIRHKFRDEGAVQNVPIPDARGFSRPDQTSLHTGRDEVFGEPLGEG